ncbi:hypothetical protein ABK040_007219 [Willaertia magna]
MSSTSSSSCCPEEGCKTELNNEVRISENKDNNNESILNERTKQFQLLIESHLKSCQELLSQDFQSSPLLKQDQQEIEQENTILLQKNNELQILMNQHLSHLEKVKQVLESKQQAKEKQSSKEDLLFNNNNESLLLAIDKPKEEGKKVNKKYSDHLHNFFPREIVDEVQYDSEEALSYLTPYQDAFEIATIINDCIKLHTNYFPNHIIDGTGGLGGNVIGFLRYFWNKKENEGKQSIAMIEMDKKRCEMARHNISLFEDLEKKHNKYCLRCDVYNDNFVEWWKREKVNIKEKGSTVIFMDPPWGNQDYKLYDTIEDLYMMQENKQSISVKELTKELLLEDGVQCVVLKVPHNFSEYSLIKSEPNTTFKDNNKNRMLRVYSILMKKVKYVLVFYGKAYSSKSNKSQYSTSSYQQPSYKSTSSSGGSYDRRYDDRSYYGSNSSRHNNNYPNNTGYKKYDNSYQKKRKW